MSTTQLEQALVQLNRPSKRLIENVTKCMIKLGLNEVYGLKIFTDIVLVKQILLPSDKLLPYFYVIDNLLYILPESDVQQIKVKLEPIFTRVKSESKVCEGEEISKSYQKLLDKWAKYSHPQHEEKQIKNNEDSNSLVMLKERPEQETADDEPWRTVCTICNEKFVSQWDNDEEIWFYNDCVRLTNGRLMHMLCFQAVSPDAKNSKPTA